MNGNKTLLEELLLTFAVMRSVIIKGGSVTIVTTIENTRPVLIVKIPVSESRKNSRNASLSVSTVSIRAGQNPLAAQVWDLPL